MVRESLANTAPLSSLILSVKIACVSSSIACVLGTMVSLLFWKSGSRVKRDFWTIFGRQSSFRLSSPPLHFAVLAIFGNMFTNYWKLCLTYAIIEILCHQNRHGQSGGLDTGFEEASWYSWRFAGQNFVQGQCFHVSAREIIGGAVFLCRRLDECVIIGEL